MAIQIEAKRTSNVEMDTFSVNEMRKIDDHVEYELNQFQQKMVYFGGFINTILAVFFVATSHYNNIKPLYLVIWFAAITIGNIINIGFTYKNRQIILSQIKSAQRTYHLTVGLLSFVWGCVGLFYPLGGTNYHLYVITYLQIALVGFCFGTVTDYKACVICAICILIPYSVLRIYSGIHSFFTFGQDVDFNITYIMSLIIITIFLLIASYIGYRLIRKFFRLSFEKVILSLKLTEANKFLEQRVKERTIELEDSLKLVTYQSTHDLLTDLPNHRLLLEHIDAATVTALENRGMFIVINLSINEIEKINDAMGQDAGDIVIKTIAERFKKKFDNLITENFQTYQYTVTLSRKDVFVILIEPVYESSEVEDRIQIIFNILKDPILVEGHILKLTSSIGASLYPRDGTVPKDLLKNAATAMLCAKQLGGNNLTIYTPENNVNLLKQLELESRLHTADIEAEFVLHYQPIIDLRTGKICGAEALVRWKSPTFGFVPPNQFIPLAESNGVIFPLGDWIFRTACKQTKLWREQGFNDLMIAINLSSKQLHKKNFFHKIKSIIDELELDPQYIELELTESVAFQPNVIPIIKQFKSLGLRLAIDDFGTGYSGLSSLKLFVIDKIKIDQSFVKDVITNNDSETIVSNTIRLAKKLHVEVLAEGVETAEQLNFLQDQKCDLVQGYHFSPPVDAEMFTEILKKNKFIYDIHV